MKKAILFIFMSACLIACGKHEKGIRACSEEEREALEILKGSWEEEDGDAPEVISFIPSGTLKKVEGALGGVMYFHGKSTRKFLYLNKDWETWNMYFRLNVKDKTIMMNGIDKDGRYSIIRAKIYDYKIINNNTISLHDKSLSWMHEYNYKRAAE